MGFGVSYPCQNLVTKIIKSMFFSININLPCTMWKSTLIYFISFLRCINMWFRTWYGKENTWVELFQMLLFRGYLHWFCWKQMGLRSILPPWLNLSKTPEIIWRRFLIIWKVWISRAIWGWILHIFVLKYWLIMNALRFMWTLILSPLLCYLHLWGYLWFPISSLGYSEVQVGYIFHQEIMCVLILFHRTRGSHYKWLPCKRVYTRIPWHCLFKSVGTWFCKGEVSGPAFTSKVIQCDNWSVVQQVFKAGLF